MLEKGHFAFVDMAHQVCMQCGVWLGAGVFRGVCGGGGGGALQQLAIVVDHSHANSHTVSPTPVHQTRGGGGGSRLDGGVWLELSGCQ
jgi:hypothetical protein